MQTIRSLEFLAPQFGHFFLKNMQHLLTWNNQKEHQPPPLVSG